MKNHFRRQVHVSQVWESATMCATSWCADSTLIDHVNEIRFRANINTALIRLMCDSIGSWRLNCWSGHVLHVWIIAMTNIIWVVVLGLGLQNELPILWESLWSVTREVWGRKVIVRVSIKVIKIIKYESRWEPLDCVTSTPGWQASLRNCGVYWRHM